MAFNIQQFYIIPTGFISDCCGLTACFLNKRDTVYCTVQTESLNVTDVNLVYKGLSNAPDDIEMFNHTPLSCLFFKDGFSVAYARPIHRGMQNYYEG